MLPASGKELPLIFIGLVVMAAVLFLLALRMFWLSHRRTDARKMAIRLQRLVPDAGPGKVMRLQKPLSLNRGTAFDRVLPMLPGVHSLERQLMQAGMPWSAIRLLVLCLACGLSGAMMAAMLSPRPLLNGLGVGVFTACLPLYYIRHRCRRRLQRLGQQLPEVLSSLAMYLRSGGALSLGLRMISEKMPQPIAGEFQLLHDEITFGVSLQQALGNLAVRVPNNDLRYFATALAIHSDTGGNIIEVLDKLSLLIRERQKLMAKVTVLASDAVLSAWILVIMPFALAAILTAISPALMAALWDDPIGPPMVQCALVLMAIGIVILRKSVRIRV